MRFRWPIPLLLFFFFAFAVVEYKVRGLHLLQISCCQKRELRKVELLILLVQGASYTLNLIKRKSATTVAVDIQFNRPVIYTCHTYWQTKPTQIKGCIMQRGLKEQTHRQDLPLRKKHTSSNITFYASLLAMVKVTKVGWPRIASSLNKNKFYTE